MLGINWPYSNCNPHLSGKISDLAHCGVWLSKNHTLCHLGKNFFCRNWVGALCQGPPRPKNSLPPPMGLEGSFSNFRATQPCFPTIFYFYFFLMFFGIFAKVNTLTFRIRSKKNWRMTNICVLPFSAGLMNLLAQFFNRIYYFSIYNLMPMAFLTKLLNMHWVYLMR